MEVNEAETLKSAIESYPDPYLQYIIEQHTSCERALYRMQGYFLFRKGPEGIEDFFRNLTDFLTAAANVSRIVWDASGSGIGRKRAEARTKTIQTLLGLEQRHSLSQRGWRNHLAHYETRIDDWMLTSKSHNMFRGFIGSIDSVSGIEVNEIFEQFDPNTYNFIFRGDSYPIHEILNDVRDVAQRAAGVLSMPRRARAI